MNHVFFKLNGSNLFNRQCNEKEMQIVNQKLPEDNAIFISKSKPKTPELYQLHASQHKPKEENNYWKIMNAVFAKSVYSVK